MSKEDAELAAEKRIKKEKIDTPEIENTIDHMYRDFFDYFELINSLIKIIPNEKGETNNV